MADVTAGTNHFYKIPKIPVLRPGTVIKSARLDAQKFFYQKKGALAP
jgi:hypothetical protein